jgi:tetratricopeptide (TPR) repeat protein
MASRNARIRTESMAVRLAKQPISEGYSLWDKGFTLGAMRLFIFKAESVPPFQLAGCLDAIAHLMVQVDECEDAVENFTNAAEKYDMIQNPLLAKLMRAKILDCQNNAAGAFAAVNDILKEFEGVAVADLASKDAKTKGGLARIFYYRAELSSANPDSIDAALKDATTAVTLGWDRVHAGHILVANLLQAKGDLEGALGAFKAATANVNSLAAFEGAGSILKQLRRFTEAVPFYEQAISLHPRTTLIREKAFALAEIEGQDVAAIELLDKYIATPPQEEVDPMSPPLRRCTLQKAKAAIFADSGKFANALSELEAAKLLDPADEEIQGMMTQILAAMSEPSP